MAFDNIEQFPYETDFSRLEFNGVDLGAECEMFILGKGTFDAPSRDIDQIHVPGRNGDILVDNGGWNNIKVTYPDCSILNNFDENVEKLRGYLLSNPGYHTLIDQYHPDEVRYAEFRGPLKFDAHTGTGNNSGMFDLEFNCKPQRFLVDGLNARSYTLCPYERTVSTANSSDYTYIIDTGKISSYDAGTTYVWEFTNNAAITVSNGYFYKSDGSTVAYDGETTFENGIVSIPFVGTNKTKYCGFKGEFSAKKTTDFRLVSLKKGIYTLSYYFYKDSSAFCFPLSNPTPFDAYPVLKGTYVPSGTSNTVFSCGGQQVSVNNSDLKYTTSTTVKVDFNGTDRTAATYGSASSTSPNYGGISGEFPIITGGTSSVLKITNAASVGNYFSITPMYYKI